MKTSTKILIILTIAFSIASGFLFRYLREAIVPTGAAFEFNFSPLAWVSLAVFVVANVLGGILFFKFVSRQKLSTALIFSVVPTTLVYGLLVSYISSVKGMNDVTAQSVKAMLNISSAENSYNNILWVVIATIAYLFVILLTIILLCKPLSKVERVTKNLGDGRVKGGDFKVGGVKQFREIENSLNKINFECKQCSAAFRVSNSAERKTSKQVFKFFGRENLSKLYLGGQVKKNATLLLCDLQCDGANAKTLSLEENFDYINSYLKVVYPIIKRFGGFVERNFGDGALAVFGSSQEAIECAHEITREIDVKNRRKTLSIRTRIDIHTAEVNFALVGEEDKSQPQIIGDIFQVLKKMQETNSYIGANILISKTALENLPSKYQFDCRNVGTMDVDDKNKLVIFESFETLPKRKRERFRKVKNNFEAGVRAYNQKNFKQAKQEFETVLRFLPDDKPAYVYFNKISEELKENA